MIVKMLITFDYNPDTNEYTPISKELVEEKKKATPKPKVEESADPQITLQANKYTINQAAAALMGVAWEDRLSIQYRKVEGVLFPIIGKDTAFDTPGAGNKVTKSLTVCCKGNAREMLSKYGDTFTVTKLKDKDGLFVLLGNAERPEESQSDEVEIKEDEEPNIDLPLQADIDDEDAFQIDESTFDL